LVGSWETLPRQNSTYLLFCTRKYCNFATTNLLCARGRIKTSQKNDPPQPHHGLDKKITTEEDSSHSCPHSQRSGARACWGAPRSSRRALTPRCPPTRQKRRGRGFGRGGGRGGGRLGDLPAPTGARRRRRRRRRSRRCRVDGGVVNACVEGCLFVPGGELNEIKNRKKTSLPYMAAYR
jgi:hypothetical protein